MRVDELDFHCLDRAVIAAVKNNNHFNIGKLVVKGAQNIDEALQLSIDLKHHTAIAMLLFIKAAQFDDKNLVWKLFDCMDTSSATLQSLVKH